MDDRRFRALTLTLRGAYSTLLDEADAAGVYAPAPGASLWQSVCLALGCAEAEARSLLADLERGGAVTIGNGSVTLHVGVGGGSQGGKSKALLMRESRARKNAAKVSGDGSAVTAAGNVGGNAEGNVAGNSAVTDSAQLPANKAVHGGNESVTQTVTRVGEETVTPAPSPLPPVSPLTLPSLTLPPSPPPSDCENARAVEKGGEALVLTGETLTSTSSGSPKVKRAAKATKAKVEPRPDTIPDADTLAFRVYRAIVTDPELGRITGHPGEFATRISDPEMHPGVDVLATVKGAAEYLDRHRGEYRDGRAFLRKSLERAAARAANAPRPAFRPAVATPTPATTRPNITPGLSFDDDDFAPGEAL